jgi:hypothetical protein
VDRALCEERELGRAIGEERELGRAIGEERELASSSDRKIAVQIGTMIETRVRSRSISKLPALALGALIVALGGGEAAAKPGTHPVVVSTWDTRASNVLLQYRKGFLDGGSFNSFSYNANFSATSGKLGAQFGIHYVNYDEPGDAPKQHGLAGSATAVFNFPIGARYDNGLSKLGIGLYFGSAPTALISGERNYLSIPFLFGFGVPVTPHKLVTITPWLEFSPGVNLDTVIHDYSFEGENYEDYINEDGEIELTQDDVERVLSDSVDLDVSVSAGARAGLDLALHASDLVDFTANLTLSSVGTAFRGERVIYLGGGLVWRWDDIVPAVLPPEKRLLDESCDDIETRFRSCPNRGRWRAPEDLENTPPRAPAAPALTPEPAQPPLAPPAPPPPPPAPTPTPTQAPPPPPPPAPPAAGPAPSTP